MRGLSHLLQIMRRLRDPETGCEWDRAQDFASIAPYTIEEAYEVADAIARGDLQSLREELGDLLLQVVFHSQMASEIGAFDFDDVAAAIVDKMERRHPHIFGKAGGTMDTARWEDLKAAERAQAGTQSAMDGVAAALPALQRAQKLQDRAARDGFDWPDPEGPLAKLREEIEEFTGAANHQSRIEEAGDLLFSAVNLLRKSGIDAEAALRDGNAKFARRYRAMEALAAGQFASLPLEEQERLWRQAKAQEPEDATRG